MEIKDNFSIFNLFLEKKVKIYINKKYFIINIPTIREFSLNEILNSSYHVWTSDLEKLEEIVSRKLTSSFDFLNIILFQLGIYREYQDVVENFKESLQFFIPDIKIDYQNKQLIVDDITITKEI